jgi:hypothetical protein
MEHLFSPCTRYRDIAESQEGRLEEFEDFPEELALAELFLHRDNGIDFEPLQELNLDVSIEDFLSAERAFTYADLYDMAGNLDTIAWLTPHTAVFRGNGLAKDYFDFGR